MYQTALHAKRTTKIMIFLIQPFIEINNIMCFLRKNNLILVLRILCVFVWTWKVYYSYYARNMF